MFGNKARKEKATQEAPSTGLAYCERPSATATSPHHIRVLTDAGLKRGGGADTPALCGDKVAWDTHTVPSLDDIELWVQNSHEASRLCVQCVEVARTRLG